MDGEWCRELSSPIRVRRWLELCETPVSVWEWSTCSGGTTPVTHGEKDTGGRRGGEREQGGGGAREERRHGGGSHRRAWGRTLHFSADGALARAEGDSREVS